MEEYEELLEVAESFTGCLTEATFDTESENFIMSLNGEIEAFANRRLCDVASTLSHSLDHAITNSFMVNSARMVDRVQYMTSAQRADLFAKIELGVRKFVKSNIRGKDDQETNELATRLSNSIIMGIKSRIEGGQADLAQKEI